MIRKLEDVFNDCYERIQAGESLDRCLADYPKAPEKLRSMLLTAMALRRDVSNVEARPEFRSQLRTRLQGAFIYDQRRKQLSSGGFNFKQSWVMATSLFLLILIIGSGAVAAADNSMPAQALYPVKLATEQAKLTLTLNESDKAILHVEYAEKRAGEIAWATSTGSEVPLEGVTEQLTSHLEQATAYVDRVSSPTQPTSDTQSMPALIVPPPLEIATTPGKATQPPLTITPVPVLPSVVPPPTVGQTQVTTTPSQPTKAPVTTQPSLTVPPIGQTPVATALSPLRTSTSIATRNTVTVQLSQAQLQKAIQLKQFLSESAPRSIASLEKALADAPPQNRQTLLKAIERIKAEYERALKELRQIEESAGSSIPRFQPSPR